MGPAGSRRGFSAIVFPVRLPRLALALAACVCASACSSSPAPASPSTPVSTPTPAPTTPPVTTTCTFTLSTTNISVAAIGGAQTITVTSGTGCAWTATTTASFVTITSGTSGTGNGSVALNIAQDPTSNRTGTVTIAGQTVTISQAGAGLIAAFDMFDPPTTTGPVTVCTVRGATVSTLTNCPLLTTSRSTTSSVANWAWTIRYTYGGVAKTQTQNSGTISDFYFNEYCGVSPASATGTLVPITVTLTVTDANGVTATATSGSGTQPALSYNAYTCGS